MKSKTLKLIFTSVIILTIFLPYLLTRPSYLFSVDFSESGEIGDTIGGITAPILSLFAAYLVYISFEEQRKANQHLSKESSFTYINSLFKTVVEKFDKDFGSEKLSLPDTITNISKSISSLEEYRDIKKIKSLLIRDETNLSLRSEIIQIQSLHLSLKRLIAKVEKHIFNFLVISHEVLNNKTSISQPLKSNFCREISEYISLFEEIDFLREYTNRKALPKNMSQVSFLRVKNFYNKLEELAKINHKLIEEKSKYL